MIRIGLSMYLMLTTVAGPGLCCCVPGRLAQILAFGGSKTEQIAGAAPQESCCHRKPASSPNRQEKPSRDHSKPGCPDSPTCPCKQASLKSALPAQEAEHPQTLVRNFFGGLVGFLPALTCLPSVTLDIRGWERDATLPFLSAHDFLTTLHILRC